MINLFRSCFCCKCISSDVIQKQPCMQVRTCEDREKEEEFIYKTLFRDEKYIVIYKFDGVK